MTGADLRTALGELNLSQREFARRLGASPVTVFRWLSGALPVPQYAQYVAVLLKDAAIQQATILALVSSRSDTSDRAAAAAPRD